MATQVKGTMTEGYVSNIDFLHLRDIYHKIYNRYDEGTIIDFFEQTGRELLTNNSDFHWWEKDWIYSTIAVASFTGGASAGASAVITVASASHQNSGTRSPFKKNDILMIGDSKVIVTAKSEAVDSAHTLTVLPIKSTVQLDSAGLANGVTVVNITNAHGEGTGQPDSTISTPIKFINNTQIFKTKFDVTGTEATNKTEVAVTNSDKHYYFYEGADDAFIKHKLDMEYGLLLGVQGDGNAVVDGTEVRTTKGMDEFIGDYGQTENYTGSFNQMAYINSIIKKLSKERAPKENLMMNGIDLNLDVDDLISDVMKSGGIQYNQFGKGDSKKKCVDLGFDSFVKGSFTFHKKEFEALNHPNITSATGQSWPSTGYVIPLEKVRDAKTAKNMDTIALRYKANDKDNRKYKHWVRNVEITNTDALEFNYMSDKGLHFATPNRFVKVDKTA